MIERPGCPEPRARAVIIGSAEALPTVIHFYFGVDLISVISVQAFFT